MKTQESLDSSYFNNFISPHQVKEKLSKQIKIPGPKLKNSMLNDQPPTMGGQGQLQIP